MIDPPPTLATRGATFPACPRALLVAVIALLPAVLPAQADPLQNDADALESCMVTAWPRNVLALCTATHSACRLDLTARRVVNFHARLVTGG